MRVLALNCGSSSLKYALFEAGGSAPRALARDQIERIGEAVPDHETAVHMVFDELERHRLASVDAVGHRVVHGGPLHTRPERIDDALVATLRTLIPFSPVHLPAEIDSIGAARARFGDAVHVACFDTAFHATLSEVARRFALPRRFYDDGVRRYGFHGLSYEHVVDALGAKTLGRAVIAHLGSGSSLCAVSGGQSVDTTMAFTPTAGIVMGTRSGDIDPGLVTYLLRSGYDADSFDRLVNRESGLLALSETTADMKRIVEARERDPRARLAVDVFCWHARKAAGALAASLDGIDSLVFTGGIGARSPVVRRGIAAGLTHLGVSIDDAKNNANAGTIHDGHGRVAVYVTTTDEEARIARHAARIAAGA
jgi:acetate kinase